MIHDDRWARTVLQSVWGDRPKTLAALQTVQAIGRFEGRYGYPNDPAWTGSHNWGGVQQPHPTPENSFEHVDRDKEGRTYTGHFKRYATDEEGAADLLRELYRRPSVAKVIDRGCAIDVATEMRNSRYFEAPKLGYAKAIAANAKAIAKNLGEPLAVTLCGGSTDAYAFGFVMLGAIALSVLTKTRRGSHA